MKTTPFERNEAISLVTEAVSSGASQKSACEILGISAKRLQRWKSDGLIDKRKGPKNGPKNKLTTEEASAVLSVINSEEYCNLPPSQIVPRLADKGMYYASESTMYRMLKANAMNTHRLESKPANRYKPTPFVATGPCQIWSWDITYLPSSIKGKFYYLYLFMDIYSRFIVGAKVYENESAENAKELVNQITFDENAFGKNVVLHSDNGSPMKGATMLATLQKLGVIPSFSRPSVSNDNPYSESLFRVLKYCPSYPKKPFYDIDSAKQWVANFVSWYNYEQLHSSIKFVTPYQRHIGVDEEILANRKVVYCNAKNSNPIRWSRKTRNWEKPGEVHLNPLKEKSNGNNFVKQATCN